MYILLSRYEFRVEAKQNTLPQQILKLKKKEHTEQQRLSIYHYCVLLKRNCPLFKDKHIVSHRNVYEVQF